MNKLLSKLNIPLYFVVLCGLLNSCVSPKDVIYFQGASSNEKLVAVTDFVPKYQVDDILNIVVTTENPESSRPFNRISPGEEQENGVTTGYLIDSEGNITFPVVGKVKVAGLSRTEAAELLTEKLKVYLKNPTVDIRISNFKITVTGAVSAPGSFTIPNERLTIVEALGLAGDLTIRGKRNNILVIRDVNGVKEFFRIDITSKEIFNSPAYYLRQNDVIYVEPNIAEVRTAGSNPNLFAVIVSLAGLGIATATLITTLNN
ncbi:polysaccharide biosynthesis/export family protein [Spongiivirga sp. MCCC 1A20706]|uniref:polysaccharide biosynthesis/export family protein n=1 Tax=Spongiivirga sp. MCCC 1A20706 TaxID=3160963 RepID=UPI0039775198